MRIYVTFALFCGCLFKITKTSGVLLISRKIERCTWEEEKLTCDDKNLKCSYIPLNLDFCLIGSRLECRLYVVIGYELRGESV